MTETEPTKKNEQGLVFVVVAILIIILTLIGFWYGTTDLAAKAKSEFNQIDVNFDHLANENTKLQLRIAELETIANESDSVTLPGTNGMFLTRGINNGTHLLKFVEFFSCRNLNHTINCIRNSATETVVQENKNNELSILFQ